MQYKIEYFQKIFKHFLKKYRKIPQKHTKTGFYKENYRNKPETGKEIINADKSSI